MLKKLFLLAVIGFVAYYLLTTPASAARVVGDGWDAAIAAFEQVGVFVAELVGS